MESKGTIFIVEDQEETKIGVFADILKRNGFKIVIAENYEDADAKLGELVASNELDGIILDFSFPYSTANSKRVDVVNGREVPNGVMLLKKYLFKINNQRVPIVINSTAEKAYREEYLKGISLEEMFVINTETVSLTNPGNDVKSILELFASRSERRNIEKKVQADRSWMTKGRAGTMDPKTGKFYYNRDGD